MADRMQTLQRKIVSVVARLTCLPSPTNERGMQAFADLLLLFIEQLLRHLFPQEAQIANGWHQPQTDTSARREQNRSVVIVVVVLLEKCGGRFVGKITRRKNVRNRR